MGFWLGSVATILECTRHAFTSPWVQNMLADFSRETGYQIHQGIFTLHDTWTAKRDRWWCIVSHPALNLRDLPAMPALRFQPGLLHLTSALLHLEGDPLSQLLLDPNELEHFAAVREGYVSNFVDTCKPLPTATHSWGSQLKACLCGCRTAGFHPQRLAEKGLYGQLLAVPGHTEVKGQMIPNSRHLHPAEVALANGMNPDILFLPPHMPLRLDLAGVGQLSSPLQSAWILGNMLFQVAQQQLISWNNHPRLVLFELCQDLFASRDRFFPLQDNTPYMKIFEREIQAIAYPMQYVHIDMSQDDPEDTEDLTQAIADALQELDNTERPQPAQPTAALPILSPPNAFEPQCSHDQFQVGAVPGFAPMLGTDSLAPRSNAMQTKVDTIARERSRSRSPIRKPASLIPLMDDTHHVVHEAQHIRETQIDVTPGSPVQPSEHHADAADIGQPADCVFVIYPQGHSLNVEFSSGQTVRDLLQAEKAIQSITRDAQANTFLGTSIDLDLPLQDGQAFSLIESTGDMAFDLLPPSLSHASRAELLWQQKGWTAPDEMDFYLHMVEDAHPSTTFGLFEIPDTPDKTAMLANKLLQMIQATSADLNSSEKMMVCKFRNHWFPICTRVAQPDVEIWTTPDHSRWLQGALEATVEPHGFQIRSMAMPHGFPADCGFQSIGWIISMLRDEDSHVPWTMHQAFQWRGLFHQHVQDTNQDHAYVVQPISLGGAKPQHEQLCDLVTQHGVAVERGPECANQLIKALGPKAIQQVLSSPKPWADLKAKASLQQIRVVLASELQEVIAQRAKTDKPVGRKHTKVKPSTKAPTNIQLQADQLMVPPAVFRQTDGTVLNQLQLSQVCQGCRGIVVANIDESIPYFGLQAPLSSGGVGLLVLDFQDNRLPTTHTVVKVPAVCTTTSEPVIVTAALVQLGATAVERNMPDQCIAIQEVPNSVLRVLVFRDQFPGQWKDFASGPVKIILDHAPFDQVAASDVLDIWDRQFLSLRMRKEKPSDAELFVFNVRLADTVCGAVLSESGRDGLYYEPRSQDGREPHPGFQVVWLPRKSCGEAKVAQTATSQTTTLVRNGDRYGLRVKPEDAEAVHQQHRPELQFLQGSDLKKFKMGPMPYGSTKQSIMNLCKRWGWQARPIGPQGQTADRSGTMWALQSAQSPPSWVYQLAHGDVLISPEEVAAQPVAQPMSVLASQKTLMSLKQPHQAPTSDDPWLHHDPWKSTARPKELSVGQVHSIEANLEKKLIAKLQPGDANMSEVDERVSVLEQQIEQLTTSVQAFQQEGLFLSFGGS